MPRRRDVDSWERFDEVERDIERAVDKGVKEAADRILELSEEAYDQERDVLGRRWKELSPVTIAKKGHDRILVEDGEMRESGFVKKEPDGPVMVGYDDWKVAIHEWGTEDIPARPIIQPMATVLRHDLLKETVAETLADELDAEIIGGR